MTLRVLRTQTKDGARWRATFAGQSALGADRLAAVKALEAGLYIPTLRPPEVIVGSLEYAAAVYEVSGGWVWCIYARGEPSKPSALLPRLTALSYATHALAQRVWTLREDFGVGLFAPTLLDAECEKHRRWVAVQLAAQEGQKNKVPDLGKYVIENHTRIKMEQVPR